MRFGTEGIFVGSLVAIALLAAATGDTTTAGWLIFAGIRSRR